MPRDEAASNARAPIRLLLIVPHKGFYAAARLGLELCHTDLPDDGPICDQVRPTILLLLGPHGFADLFQNGFEPFVERIHQIEPSAVIEQILQHGRPRKGALTVHSMSASRSPAEAQSQQSEPWATSNELFQTFRGPLESAFFFPQKISHSFGGQELQYQIPVTYFSANVVNGGMSPEPYVVSRYWQHIGGKAFDSLKFQSLLGGLTFRLQNIKSQHAKKPARVNLSFVFETVLREALGLEGKASTTKFHAVASSYECSIFPDYQVLSIGEQAGLQLDQMQADPINLNLTCYAETGEVHNSTIIISRGKNDAVHIWNSDEAQ